MHTIEFTSDSYNFLNNCSTLHDISIFNIIQDVFMMLKVYFSLIEYIFLISYVTEYPMFESFAQINFSMSYLYIYHDIQCMSFTSLIYMRHIPEYELLLTNTLYNLLLLSFPKTILQYTTDKCHEISAHNRYSVTYCLFLAIIMVSLNQVKELSIIYFMMKIVKNGIFSHSLKISLLSVTDRSLLIMLCNVAFDGVLGGVMGTVCSVMFGVLSTFGNFTQDGILGMTTCGSNWYFVFLR